MTTHGGSGDWQSRREKNTGEVLLITPSIQRTLIPTPTRHPSRYLSFIARLIGKLAANARVKVKTLFL